MNKVRLFLLFAFFFFILLSSEVRAEDVDNLVNVYLFHSSSCSHCKSEIKFWNSIVKKYDNVKVYKYEIHDDNNNDFMKKVASEYKISSNSVPLTVIGDKSFIGYSEDSSKSIFLKTITYYSKYGYKDRVAGIVGNKSIPSYKKKNTQISVNSFLKSYGNYTLIGNIKTEKMNMETISIICSLIMELNASSLIFGIVILLIYFRISRDWDKVFFIGSYVLFYILFNFLFLIHYIVLIYVIGIMVLIGSCFGYFRLGIRNGFLIGLASFIGLLANLGKILIRDRYQEIFFHSMEIHWLSSFEIIEQYSINIMVSLFTCVLLLLLAYYCISFIRTNLFRSKKLTKSSA